MRDGEARVLYRKLQETAGPDYPEDLRQHLLHLRHVHEAHKGHGEVEAGVLEGKLRGACPPVPDVRGLAGLLFLRAVDVVLGDDYPDKSFRNPEWPGWSFISMSVQNATGLPALRFTLIPSPYQGGGKPRLEVTLGAP